jgi:hypothetical protein
MMAPAPIDGSMCFKGFQDGKSDLRSFLVRMGMD